MEEGNEHLFEAKIWTRVLIVGTGNSRRSEVVRLNLLMLIFFIVFVGQGRGIVDLNAAISLTPYQPTDMVPECTFLTLFETKDWRMGLDSKLKQTAKMRNLVKQHDDCIPDLGWKLKFALGSNVKQHYRSNIAVWEDPYVLCLKFILCQEVLPKIIASLRLFLPMDTRIDSKSIRHHKGKWTNYTHMTRQWKNIPRRKK